MNSPCNHCGMCCRNIGLAVTLARQVEDKAPVVQELSEFPHKWDDDGVCEHHKDNRCAIYDHRPDVCNIARTWWKHFRPMKRQEFFDVNKAVCDTMKPND